MAKKETLKEKPVAELTALKQRVTELEALLVERKQTEKQVRENEESLKTYFDKAPDGIYLSDLKGVFLYGNKKAEEILGYKKEELIGNNFLKLNLLPAKYLVKAGKLLAINALGRNTGPDEFELILKDKGLVWVEINTTPIKQKGKRIVIGFVRDITQRKQSEEALKASEEKYSTLIEQSADGIVILNDRIVEFANKMMFEMTGYSQDEILGKSFPELFAPEYVELLNERYQRRQSGEKFPDNYELGLLTKDNRKIYVETKIQPIAYKGRDARMVIIRNITQKKIAEEAMTKIQTRYHELVNTIPSGVILFKAVDNGEDFVFMDVNNAAEKMDGINRKDVIGKRVTEVLPDVKDYYWFGVFQRVWRTGNTEYFSSGERKNEKDTGRWRDNWAYKLPSGEIVNVYDDITDKKLAEEALKASENSLRNSLDNSPIGIRISDRNDDTLYANQSFLNVFGYSNIEELKANPPLKQYTPAAYADFLRRMESQRDGAPRPDSVDIDIVRKDGNIRHLRLFTKELVWYGKQQFQNLYYDITERKATEEALRASEEKYRLIVENSHDIIFTLDSAGEFRYVSPSVKQVLGYDQADLMGLPFNSLIHPEDRHIIEDAIQNGDKASHHQYRFRHTSGEWRWLASRGTKMLDTRGKSFNFTGIANDITERKQTEEALAASEKNFRNSMDSSLAGIRIMGDADYTLYANQALLDMFGYKNIEELRASPPQGHYTPESYAGFIRRKEQFARGELLPDQLEFDIVREDGAIRHLQLSSKDVLWNGKQQHQILYNDITERKQTEKKLEQAAQEWRTTFDSITDLISIHDKDNRIIRVNKAVADMLKKTPKELIGKYCHEVMHGTKEPPANCPHLQTLKTGKPAAIETLNPIPEAYFHESSSPLFNEKGEITGSIIVARDVTQQKRIEEQLIMTDRLASIGELSSGIAHELNNPLTSVIGFSQLLMEDDVPENIKEDLATVYNEAQRAAAIVKNLLTFARKHAPVKQLCQVNTIIEDVLRLRTYEQKVNNIEVEKRLAANLPGIMIDYFQMQQVFLNIIINAEFAMLEARHQGRLIITTAEVNDIIRISFADDGPGISEENLKHIFDPFFTTKEVGKGTGLGLSICHGVVTEHRGKIYARSEKGQGATFIVELPVNG